ncbi:hypothetical protein V8C86DRAFT_3161690 [Haematococcus lacustris]
MQPGGQLAPRSLIVSLDIGSHDSAFAFATKTPAGKLASPVAWGHTAIRKLCALCDEGQDISQYRLVKDFKLALHDPKHTAELQAAAPGLTPENAMADFLTYLCKYVIEQLVEEVGSDAARLDNIHWCLTVPAMWTERDKAAMRTAALRAGLIQKAGSDALNIVSEPEAAAMGALDKQDPLLVAGMSLMVVDAVAGTVDVTVHNCQALGGQVVLSEATCCARALCGSLYVDNEFRWEAVKYTFSRDQRNDLAVSMSRLRLGADDLGSSEAFRVPIPSKLVDLMSKDQRCSLKQQQHGLDSQLVLSSSVMRQLFKGPVDDVCRLAVLLVGEFARNRYLRARMRAAVLGSGLAEQVVVPDAPHVAVLAGAAGNYFLEEGFLGMEISRDCAAGRLVLSQERYAASVVDCFGLAKIKPRSVSLSTS